jgi:hypothetical protein
LQGTENSEQRTVNSEQRSGQLAGLLTSYFFIPGSMAFSLSIRLGLVAGVPAAGLIGILTVGLDGV